MRNLPDLGANAGSIGVIVCEGVKYDVWTTSKAELFPETLSECRQLQIEQFVDMSNQAQGDVVPSVTRLLLVLSIGSVRTLQASRGPV